MGVGTLRPSLGSGSHQSVSNNQSIYVTIKFTPPDWTPTLGFKHFRLFQHQQGWVEGFPALVPNPGLLIWECGQVRGEQGALSWGVRPATSVPHRNGLTSDHCPTCLSTECSGSGSALWPAWCHGMCLWASKGSLSLSFKALNGSALRNQQDQ